MAFDEAGFRAAAQKGGYDPGTVDLYVSAIKSRESSPEYIQGQQLKTTQLNQAQLNLKQDQNNAKLTDPTYWSNLANKGYISREDAIAHGVDVNKVGNLKTNADIKTRQDQLAQDIKDFKEKQAVKEPAKNTIDQLNLIKEGIGKNPFDAMNPASVTGQNLQTKQKLMTQFMAKLIEKNRLSDEDRKFYLKQTNPTVWDVVIPGRYEARIQGIVDTLSNLYGTYGSNTKKKTPLPDVGMIMMTSPDGKKYNVPSAKVKEAQQNGWK